MQDGENLYFLMEYFPGGELKSYITKNLPMNNDDIRFYMCEIILALEKLHSLNIVYRDLKPENIMIDKKGHIRLVDYGFAKQLKTSSEKTYTQCGTPGYIAPEILLK